jgi:hypothetical protein
MQMIRFALCAVALVFAVPLRSPIQTETPNEEPDLGSLIFDRTEVVSPAPESLVKDLRSEDDARLTKALGLLGIPQRQLPSAAEIPEEVQLRYAALGTDQTEQAIISVNMPPMLFGAVVARKKDGWRRIASFSCWCKYESDDLLGDFVKVDSGTRTELVLHASGGGTGIYSQTEARFRYYRGELKLVFSFISNQRECDPTAPGPYKCRVERRWFYQTDWDSVAGAVLVESSFSFPADAVPEAEWAVSDLELRNVKAFSCKKFKWERHKFAYEQLGSASPCRPSPPLK